MKTQYEIITTCLGTDDKCIDLGYRYLPTGL
jgi:hypothetical protein